MNFSEYLKEDHFEIGTQIKCPGDRNGIVKEIKKDEAGNEIYVVEIEGELVEFKPEDLTAV